MSEERVQKECGCEGECESDEMDVKNAVIEEAVLPANDSTPESGGCGCGCGCR